MLMYTVVVAVCLLVASSGVSAAQSLQAPTPVAAPAGMCDDGSAAGQLTVSGTGTVSVTSDAEIELPTSSSRLIRSTRKLKDLISSFVICDHAP